MGKIVGLHARFAGPHFQTKALRFGREWRTHCASEDMLEFSEYGRGRLYRNGSWLLLSIGIGVLMWMAIFATVF
jgi:hypothetical protein